MVSHWVDAFLCLRDRKIILLAQIKTFFLLRCMADKYDHEWIKSHLLTTQWLIFGVLNFAGVFFLLELVFTDQVPSAIPSKFKSRIIKVLQGMFVKSLFWNSSLLLSHSLIADSAMIISKLGSRLRPTEDACLCSWSIYKLSESIAVTYLSIKYLNCYVFLKKIKNPIESWTNDLLKRDAELWTIVVVTLALLPMGK